MMPRAWMVLWVSVPLLAGGCHRQEDPTARKPAAHEGSIAEGIDCANCHTPDGWRIGGSGAEGGAFDHAKTGFPLTGRHRQVACTDCHVAGQQVRRECRSCHEDPHQAQMGNECDTCHSAQGWELTRALEIHRHTLLPLTGMHALADCTECHRRQGETFVRNVPSDCYGCHASDYHRTDVHPNHDGTAGSAPFPHDCSECHRPIGWSPALIDPASLPGALSAASALSATASAPADHDLSFPISFGAHRDEPCQSCHVAPAMPRIVRCTGCHAHDAVQVRLHHPNMQVSTDGPGCLGCHPGGMAR